MEEGLTRNEWLGYEDSSLAQPILTGLCSRVLRIVQNQSLVSSNLSLAKRREENGKSENAYQRLTAKTGNSVLQICIILCSDMPMLPPTGGNDGTNFSVWKLWGVAGLGGWGTRIRT